ncbi:hypothetical protein V8E36_007315 [Tilletia maclaganii]
MVHCTNWQQSPSLLRWASSKPCPAASSSPQEDRTASGSLATVATRSIDAVDLSALLKVSSIYAKVGAGAFKRMVIFAPHLSAVSGKHDVDTGMEVVQVLDAVVRALDALVSDDRSILDRPLPLICESPLWPLLPASDSAEDDSSGADEPPASAREAAAMMAHIGPLHTWDWYGRFDPSQGLHDASRPLPSTPGPSSARRQHLEKFALCARATSPLLPRSQRSTPMQPGLRQRAQLGGRRRRGRCCWQLDSFLDGISAASGIRFFIAG